MSAPPRIEIEIGELVLDGFAPESRHRIGDALERELARLLAERPISGELAGGERLDAGAFSMAPGASPEQLGAAIAGAVRGGLGR